MHAFDENPEQFQISNLDFSFYNTNNYIMVNQLKIVSDNKKESE
jgi:hypothetical protein